MDIHANFQLLGLLTFDIFWVDIKVYIVIIVIIFDWIDIAKSNINILTRLLRSKIFKKSKNCIYKLTEKYGIVVSSPTVFFRWLFSISILDTYLR